MKKKKELYQFTNIYIQCMYILYNNFWYMCNHRYIIVFICIKIISSVKKPVSVQACERVFILYKFRLRWHKVYIHKTIRFVYGQLHFSLKCFENDSICNDNLFHPRPHSGTRTKIQDYSPSPFLPHTNTQIIKKSM